MSIDFESLFNLPRDAEPPRRRRGAWVWVLVILVVAALVVVRALAGLVVDRWWFASLGQADVFRVQVLAPLAVFVAAFVPGALWLGAHALWATRRLKGATLSPARRATVPGVGVSRLAALGSVVAAGALAFGIAGEWATVLLYRARGPFGTVDPIFGRDVAFYVFELPVLRGLQSLVSLWVLVALVGVTVIYALGGLIVAGRMVSRRVRGRVVRTGAPVVDIPGPVRAHLTVLVAAYLLVVAWGQWLARFDLLWTSRAGNVFFGPGYTDIAVRLPAYTAIAGLWVVAAAIALVGARWGPVWGPLVAVVAVVALRLAFGEVAPGLVQAWRVRPDELRRETPYIAHNIAMTRRAYGLESVAEDDYVPAARIAAPDLAANRDTVAAVRLWDWRVLRDFLNQKQAIRPYYAFLDVDIDRYAIQGGQRQVELAVRELNPAGLSNRRWVNEHLEYTHGFGAALAPVNAIGPGGQPVLWLRDLPPVTSPAFEPALAEPRVYFGEMTDGRYVIVGTRTDEFDFPRGDENARTRYAGADGIDLAGGFRRLLLAMRFGDSEIVLSDALTPESRLLMYRNLRDRIRRLAPFLVLDPDPYPVITDEGRLVWIQDAYTASARFPYSAPTDANRIGVAARGFDGANYIRNSVKVVVDAYDGTVAFYVVDPADPLVAAWARVFPTLFRPVEDMPEGLVAHWRYPEALFRAQADVFARYHVTQPDVFYNAEDHWEAPLETRGQGEVQPVQPYYVTLRMRGEDGPEFVLMQPYTPVGKKNMIAWLAARSDPGRYGELVVYGFGKGSQIDGPEQVESRIDNDTEISAQLTLWSQAGSNTIRGNLLVIPMGDALLYVEPLYLQAEANALPELKRVILADGERVVMRERLEDAVAALVGEAVADAAPAGDAEDAASPAVAPPAADARPTAEGSSGSAAADAARPTPALPSTDVPGDVAGGVARARAAETRARTALEAGDWEAFGRAMAELQRALDALGALTGAPAPGSAATTPEALSSTPAPAPTPAP